MKDHYRLLLSGLALLTLVLFVLSLLAGPAALGMSDSI
ncbi:iron ABC transporter permease, partial [Salmonella enterica subsp. enterica]|nr:iron ABC transporter permease [Salmonella enterica subsp. enterica]